MPRSGESFGDWLRAERGRKGLSQEALARAIGMSGRAVARYEYGTITPTVASLVLLATYFDWDLNVIAWRFFGGKKPIRVVRM